MIRAYILPRVDALVGGVLVGQYPKYYPNKYAPPGSNLVPAGVRDALFPFGQAGAYLAFVDVDAGVDAALRAQPDLCYFSDAWDTAVGGDLARLQAQLALFTLPAAMVQAATPYRTVIRGVLGIFSIGECMAGMGRNIFAPGVTLDTTMGSLSADARADLQACVTSRGYSIAGLTLATTVRELLVSVASQVAPQTILADLLGAPL